jgi:hypothetical protein
VVSAVKIGKQYDWDDVVTLKEASLDQGNPRRPLRGDAV